MSQLQNYVEAPSKPEAISALALTSSLEIDHSSSSTSGTSTPDSTSISDKQTHISVPASNDPEKGGESWEGYQNEFLPEKVNGRWVRNLRHRIFSLYRRFFGVVLFTNLTILVVKSSVGGISTGEAGKIVVGNLMVGTLFRQAYVINALFGIFCRVPTRAPLWLRATAAEIYHIGGIHSGASFSASIWFVYFTVKITQEFLHHKLSVPTLVLTYIIVLTLALIISFAWPGTRARKHNTFEATHRFAGWFSVALFWAHTCFITNDTREPDVTLATALVQNPSFWMVIVITVSIILPWLRLRQEPVRAEVLSSHAVRLYYNYDYPVPGSFVRMSTNPLFEWHSFATIRLPNETRGFSSIISRAGDWTSKIIDEPPSKLWIRDIPVNGVMRIVPLFRRVVIVATGSGMGPCAPHVFASKTPHRQRHSSFRVRLTFSSNTFIPFFRLLWTAPNVRQTFGDKFVDAVVAASPGAVIYDTRKHGKPDMLKLTYKLVQEFQAEAVCVISNPALTYKVVYGLRSRGIHAFGAIWDS
ncbi:hypothetical protein DL93DRAFT_2171315 [Clavulina sp. PMI_390]|nr:hypothetical protein DL93DRAFT_2171315 [Clavulina sp. PMI_390]